MTEKCAQITKTGKHCHAYTQADSDYCFTHDPKSAQARALARRLGGYRHSTRTRSPFPECNVSTAEGLIAFVDALIHETWNLGNSVSSVRALSQLTQIQNELVTLREAEKQQQEAKRRHDKVMAELKARFP